MSDNTALTAALAAISNANANGEPAAPAAPVPEAPAAAPAAAPAPAPDPAPAPIPALDDLGKLVAQRKAEREAAEAVVAEKAELAKLREQVAALQQPKQTGIDPKAFLADPIGVLRAQGHGPAEIRQILKAMTQGILSPDVAVLQREIAELKATPRQAETPKEIEARLAALEAEKEAARVDAVVTQYQTLASDVAKYPALAGLDPDERVSWGDSVASRYQEAGIQLTLEQIAEIANKAVLDRHLKIQANLGGSPRTGQTGTSGAAAAPASLTNDLSATAQTMTPQTLEDRIALATRQLEDARRARG